MGDLLSDKWLRFIIYFLKAASSSLDFGSFCFAGVSSCIFIIPVESFERSSGMWLIALLLLFNFRLNTSCKLAGPSSKISIRDSYFFAMERGGFLDIFSSEVYFRDYEVGLLCLFGVTLVLLELPSFGFLENGLLWSNLTPTSSSNPIINASCLPLFGVIESFTISGGAKVLLLIGIFDIGLISTYFI